MPDPKLTCDTLFEKLKSKIQKDAQGEFLDLNADLLPETGKLASLFLDEQKQTPSAVIRIRQRDKDALLIKGTAGSCAIVGGLVDKLFPEAPRPRQYHATVEFWVKDGKVRLELEAHPWTDDWQFADNFAEFPLYEAWDNDKQKMVERKPSFYATLNFPGRHGVFTASVDGNRTSLTFRGTADMTKGGIADLRQDVPALDVLELEGDIALRQGKFPRVTLNGLLKKEDPHDPIDIVGVSLRTQGDDLKSGRSTLFVLGKSRFSKDDTDFDIESPALQKDFDWRSSQVRQDKLDRVLAKVSGFIGGGALPIPAGLTLAGFTLKLLITMRKGAKTKQDAVQTITVQVTALKDSVWNAPFFGFGLSELQLSWDITSPFLVTRPPMKGSLEGDLVMGSGETAPRLHASIDLSGRTKAVERELIVKAKLDQKHPPKLGRLFSTLTGFAMGADSDINAFTLEGNTGTRKLAFDATLSDPDPFHLKSIRLSETHFAFLYTPNSVTGTFEGTAKIGELTFSTAIAFLGKDGGWTFAFTIKPGYTLQTFVDKLLDSSYGALPAGLGGIALQDLHLQYRNQDDHFEFAGSIQWPFRLLGLNSDITAEVFFATTGVPAQTKAPGAYSGYVRGALTINNFRFTAVYTFSIAKNPTIGFEFRYNDAVLALTHTPAKEKDKRGTLTANLTGVSFGDIFDYLVHIARPSTSFRLPDPWSALYSLSFDRLVFTANLDANTVSIAYAVNRNLGFIDIRTLGLTYRKRGGRGTVVLTLTGTFFGKTYGDADPLDWDVLNDRPPATPGQGEQKFQLRYAGIGQNIGFRSTSQFTSVQSVLKQMAADFKPADDAAEDNPLARPQLSSLRFTGDGRSLIAADFTILETVTLGVVFNDPTLYGLHIALSGSRVGRLAGLEFDLLYRRVSDSVGVFHIELTLPQAFRQFELGAVSVTVPVIILDIFTNGNFRVDLGYPKGTDFTASFCLQAGPLIGYGGLYFAKLDGLESDRVPRITNGTFSPVIEAGLALSAGIGRSVDKGVFKATATLTVQGALQGVFGWFNPNDRAVAPATFYWIQGTVAVVGKLSGSVDFSIISISVSLQLSASVTLTLEAYKAAALLCEFHVSASASIKLLFIRVSFSFSTTLSLSFNIGSDSPTPWQLAPPPTPGPHLRLAQSSLARPRLSAAALQRSIAAALGVQAGSFDWQPQKLFDGIQQLPVWVLPALTVASQAPGATPRPHAVFSLFLGNNLAAEARSAADTHLLAGAAPTAFDRLCEGLLRWALRSYKRNALLGVDDAWTLATDLDALSAFLADAAQRGSTFTYSRLAQLMLLNFQFKIASALERPTLPEQSHTVFPMIPELSIELSHDIRNFKTYGRVAAGWEDALATYYAQMRPASARRAAGPMGSAEAAAASGDSLATVLFCDYFAMVTRAVVESAKDMLAAYPYTVGASERSLEQIAQEFAGPSLEYRSRAGESLEHIAAGFGIAAADLHAANQRLLAADAAAPLAEGTILRVAGPVTVESIAEANTGYPLRAGKTLSIAGVVHDVRPGKTAATESVAAIASSYNLANPLLLFLENDRPTANATNPDLLQPGAKLNVPERRVSLFEEQQDRTDWVAAFQFVRNLGPFLPSEQPWYDRLKWYEQWIATNNTFPSSSWKVPVLDPLQRFVNALMYPPQGAQGSAVAPDTPELAGAYFSLLQLAPPPHAARFAEFRKQVRRVSPGNYLIPPMAHIVRPGETLTGIASALGLKLDELLQANKAEEGILRPLSALAIPRFSYAIRGGDTLQAVAARFNRSVAELASAIQSQPGILTPAAGPSGPFLRIPDAPGRRTADLVNDLRSFGRLNNIAGMVSNFMLHGMRVPRPETQSSGGQFPPNTPLFSLYEMSGQQFPVDMQTPPGFLRQPTPVAWIDFPTAGPSGMSIGMSAAYVRSGPTGSLAPDIVYGPTGFPLWMEAAAQYPLAQGIAWQSPAAPPIPGPSAMAPQTGHPTLWPFPPALLDVARGHTAPSEPYRLTLKASTGDTARESPVSLFQWAMMVDFRVQRVATPFGDTLTDTCSVLGADQSGREQLLRAWKYLEQAGVSASLHLLYTPSSSSRNAGGFASWRLDPAQTFLLKTNLSTITRSNQQLFASAAPRFQNSATLNEAGGFLKLLWEASVTGAGGFFLTCGGAPSQSLPGDLFAENDTARLTLLLLERTQSAPQNPARGLFALNNCALTGENIDPASFSLLAAPTRPRPEQLQRHGLAPAGYAGFCLARRNPQPPGSTGPLPPEGQTRALHSLTSFRVADTFAFNASNQALPIGPVDTPPVGLSGQAAPDRWWYHQLVPVAQFGKANPAPASPALPARQANPYAGISGPTAQPELLRFDLGFSDVFGNQTEQNGPKPSATVSIGYNDELIGPAAWPGAGMDFVFQPGPSSSIELESQLSFQTGRYLPAGDAGFQQTHAAAVADAARYAQVFYQLHQHDTEFALQSSLGKPTLAPASLKASLAAFVARACVFITAAAALEEHPYTTGGGDTLDKIAATFSLTPDALLANLLDLRVKDSLNAKLTRPRFATATPSDTLTTLARQVQQTPPLLATGSAGEWINGLRIASSTEEPTLPAPAPQHDVPSAAPDDIVGNNLQAPLTPGLVLAAKDARLAPEIKKGDTLRSVATRLQSAVYASIGDTEAPRGLYPKNFTAAGILAPNISIAIGASRITTDARSTFESIRKHFAAVPEPELVSYLERVEDLILRGTQLGVDTFVVPPAFSLSMLPQRCGTAEEFARANASVQNFFLAGTPIFLSQTTGIEPGTFDTFRSLTRSWQITPAQFALANRNAEWKAGAQLSIPDLLRVPSTPLYASVVPAPDDTFARLTETLLPLNRDQALAKIAELNAQLPGIFADGVSIQLPEGRFDPQPQDSLHTGAVKFATDDLTFLKKIADKPGLLRPTGAILIPLPMLPADTTGKSLSWNDLAARFRVPAAEGKAAAVLLLETNACLEGFLREGAVLRGTDTTKQITVRKFDTVATVLRRFASEHSLRMSIADLVAQNGGTAHLLTPSARFLLPPAAATLRSAFTPDLPPKADTQLPADQRIVFPVTVSLRYTRRLEQVLPDFRNTPAIHTSLTPLTPRGWAGSAAKSTPLTAFAEKFEDAFARFRLKAAVSEPHPDDTRSSRSLWAINFGDSGVHNLKLNAAAPGFFALPPLSTELVSGTLTLHTYVPGRGLCADQTVTRSYRDVDLDVWMRQFFAAVDLVLTAPYATPAYQLHKTSLFTGNTTPPDGPRSSAELTAPLGTAFSLSAAGCTGMTGIDGPSNLDGIINGKAAIARQLRTQVQPVLATGTSVQSWKDAAQDLLFQQMLAELSDAYNVSAVVQFPASLDAPAGASGPSAPRLAGAVVPDLQTAGDDGTLRSAADRVSISPAYLARLLGDTRGLLRVGASIKVKDKTVILASNDTVNRLAARFGLDPVKGPWSAWTAWTEELAAQPLFTPGVSLPVVKIERLVPDVTGASFEEMASFFGAPSTELAHANQERTGILKPGLDIALAGQTYKTTGKESLLQIARWFKQPVEIDALYTAISKLRPATPLAPRFSLFFAQPLPGVTLSSAKLALGRQGPSAKDDPALTFVVSLKQPADFRRLFLNLRFIANELEYAIRTVEGAGGYQSSSWLTLLRPIGNGLPGDFGIELRMPQVQVPIPLRAFPTPITLVAQNSEPSNTARASTPDEAIRRSRLWDFQFDFIQANAAQDTSHIEVTLNAAADAHLRSGPSRTQRVFAALAQFMDIAPVLLEDLARLPRREPGQQDPIAAGAVAALDAITQSVAAALQSPAHFAAPLSAEVLQYRSELRTGADSRQLVVAQGATSQPWPEILVWDDKAAGFTKLQRRDPRGLTAEYDYPIGYEPHIAETQRFRFPERDITRNWNALAGAQLTRNESLIASGPLGYPGASALPLAPIGVTAGFTYETPMVRFVDPVTPFLWNTDAIDISGLSSGAGQQRSLTHHCELMLNAVCNRDKESSTAKLLTLACNYAFPVAPDSDIFVTTPVFLLTRDVSRNDTAALAGTLSDTVHKWIGWQTKRSDGRLVFDATLFASGGSANTSKPVLRLEKLVLPIRAIAG